MKIQSRHTDFSRPLLKEILQMEFDKIKPLNGFDEIVVMCFSAQLNLNKFLFMNSGSQNNTFGP